MSVVARSIIFKVFRNWLDTQGRFCVRRIRFYLEGELIALPGYESGGIVPPASDAFDSATLVERDGIWSSESTISTYSTETGEPDHANLGLTKSGWFKWTAPKSGTVYVDTIGGTTNENSVLHTAAVYTGNDVSNLTLIANNPSLNPYEGTKRSYTTFSFQAVLGQEYKIAIATSSSGDYSIKLNLCMLKFYRSFYAGYQNDYEPGIYAFMRYNEDAGSFTLGSGLLSDTAICDNVTGYIDGKEYVQFVLVLPEEIEFDSIHIRNGSGGFSGYLAEMGIREVEIFIADYEVSQADAENDLAPIPDENLIFDTNVQIQDDSDLDKNLTDEDIIIPIDLSSHGIFAGVGVGCYVTGGMDIEEADVFLGVGFGCETKASSKAVGEVKCGLGIAIDMNGGPLFNPSDILAAIGIGAAIEGFDNDNAVINAGVCIGCIIDGGNIYMDIIEASVGLGVIIEGNSIEQGEISCCIGIGCECGGNNGQQLCKAVGFEDLGFF